MNDLDSLVDTYDIDNIYEEYKRDELIYKLKINGFEILKEHQTVLELGCASGLLTRRLSKIVTKVVAIDGSSRFLEIAKKNCEGINNITFIESFFEYLAAKESLWKNSGMAKSSNFDVIIAHHVLEHVEEPKKFLKVVRNLMNESTSLILTVPNAKAFSRLLAVNMGLLDSVYELTENDKKHGHQRVYDFESLREEITKAKLRDYYFTGLSFKLFADFQNIEILKQGIIGEKQIKGLWKLGTQMPQNAGALMICCKKA
jgi:2-polyprenyl-3-methyl-5-hydroxy-6-metoxy-1,4-benzoquinol methylase